jgi:hypothetical protein
MHYKEAELYFYIKKDLDKIRLNEITAHVNSCEICRKTLKKITSVSVLLGSSLLAPPAFKPRVPAGKTGTVIIERILNFKFAVALTTAAVAGVFVFMFMSVNKTDRRENVSSFIYSTYKSVYDFEYYRSSYVDKTDILAYSEVKK